MNFTRKDEKWPEERHLDLRWLGQEKQSRLIIGGNYPADKIDQPTLPESGIVFANSRPRCWHERVTES
jgi:hypothetical protein